MSLDISNDGAGITWGGEGARLVTVWVDGQLHGRLVSAALEVFADESHDPGSTTDGHIGAVAALDN